MDLHVTEHRQLTAVQKLAHDWQALHDAAGEANPFTGPDWALTWLDHFAGDPATNPSCWRSATATASSASPRCTAARCCAAWRRSCSPSAPAACGSGRSSSPPC